MLIKLIRTDSLNKILDCSFNLIVLASKFLTFNSNPLLLHFNKFIESVGLGFLWKVNKNGLGKCLQVVLDTVLHNVVDVYDQLFEFSKTLVHVVQVTINVH